MFCFRPRLSLNFNGYCCPHFINGDKITYFSLYLVKQQASYWLTKSNNFNSMTVRTLKNYIPDRMYVQILIARILQYKNVCELEQLEGHFRVSRHFLPFYFLCLVADGELRKTLRVLLKKILHHIELRQIKKKCSKVPI